MDGLRIFEAPEQRLPTMIVAFAGWPDAAEAATRAVRYLVDSLGAKKFAEIDPEEFYDFTSVRPHTRVNDEGERGIYWPSNDFHYYSPEDESKGLLLYLGTEPSLRWRAFSNIMLSVMGQCRVEFVVSVGALLDAVPHTREPQITGRSSTPELSQKAEWLGIRDSDYQGPIGIHSVLMEACMMEGLSYASIRGHTPHYVSISPNPRVTYALLTRLRSLVDLEVDMEGQREAGEAFDAQVTREIAKQGDVTAYVRRLEQRYDAANAPTGEIPSPDAMVKELEEFLRSQQQDLDEQTEP